jgi:phospholipase/carboxylesterase
MSSPTPLETLEFETAPNPTRSVIVLHGLGDDGHGWAPITHELDLSPLGAVRFVLPHAPMQAVTINNGYVMRAWYDILGTDLVRREDERGLRASQQQLEALIAREKARGVPASRIALVGFSQGSAMALLTGLRHGERLAGIAGLSGYLPLAATTAAERSAANRDVPLFLAHGTEDPVVMHSRGTASRDALASLGHPIEWHEYPMPHSVCAEEIDDLNRWLLRVLAD